MALSVAVSLLTKVIVFLETALLFYLSIATQNIEAFNSCSGISSKTDTGGRIQYPPFGNYPNNIDCEWSINAPDSSQTIMVTVQWANIQNDESCMSDWLKFYDENNIIPFNLICGPLSEPMTLTTTISSLLIHFHTDSLVAGLGFSLNYTFLSGSCDTAGSQDTSGGWMQFPPSGTYSNNLECDWTISSPSPEQIIILTVVWIGIENDAACNSEYLAFYEDNQPALNWICAPNSDPVTYVFQLNKLRLHFHSNDYLSGNGFYLNFTFQSDPCSTNSSVTDSEGWIQYSPVSSKDYLNDSNNYNCSWTLFSTDPKESIVLTVMLADSEGSFESLSFSTMNNDEIMEITEYNPNPVTYMFPLTYLRLNFPSKGIGFVVNYTLEPVDFSWAEWSEWGICSVDCGGGTHYRKRLCIDNDDAEISCFSDEYVEQQSCNSQPCSTGFCDSTTSVTNSGGSMLFPPSGNYLDDSNCYWTIHSENNENRIDVIVDWLYTEFNYDYLSFSYMDGTEITRITGSHSEAQSYSFYTSPLLLHFHSDNSLTYTGFSLNYTNAFSVTTTTEGIATHGLTTESTTAEGIATDGLTTEGVTTDATTRTTFPTADHCATNSSMTDSGGWIQFSPESSAYYGDNFDCYWNVYPIDPETSIVLTVLWTDLEGYAETLSFNTMKVLLTELTGYNDNPINYVFPVIALQLHFKSAGITIGNGFLLTYTFQTVDVTWTELSDWSVCSAECNGGIRTRGRPCIDNDDETINCYSDRYTEQQICNTQPCSTFPGTATTEGITTDATTMTTFPTADHCEAKSLMTDSGGWIQFSPESLAYYADSFYCFWNIFSTDPDMSIVLTVLWVDLEGTTETLSFRTINNVFMTEITGYNASPMNYVFPMTALLLHFSNDGITMGKGFFLNYTFQAVSVSWSEWSEWGNCSSDCNGGIQNRTRLCIDNDNAEISCFSDQSVEQQICNMQSCSTGPCSATTSVTSSGGSILFPPSGNYSDNSVCYWTIDAGNNHDVINVTVNWLYIDACCDFLSFICMNKTEITRTTGSHPEAENYSFLTTQLLIVFYSDGSVTSTGFSLNYTYEVTTSLADSATSTATAMSVDVPSTITANTTTTTGPTSLSTMSTAAETSVTASSTAPQDATRTAQAVTATTTSTSAVTSSSTLGNGLKCYTCEWMDLSPMDLGKAEGDQQCSFAGLNLVNHGVDPSNPTGSVTCYTLFAWYKGNFYLVMRAGASRQEFQKTLTDKSISSSVTIPTSGCLSFNTGDVTGQICVCSTDGCNGVSVKNTDHNCQNTNKGTILALLLPSLFSFFKAF